MHKAVIFFILFVSITSSFSSASFADSDNYGMWCIEEYVDVFGDKTGETFVSNCEPIKGTLNNTAINVANLYVKFLIEGADNIQIKLYEYDLKHPVVTNRFVVYNVFVKDKNGEKHDLYSTNYSDRLTLLESVSESLHNILIKGGPVKFFIVERGNTATQYSFSITNTDFYESAYDRLLLDKG